MPKRTLQPSKRKRAKTHGYRSRMASSKGKLIIKRRKQKKRKVIS